MIVGLTLPACSQSQYGDECSENSEGKMGMLSGEPVADNGPVGGNIEQSMDSLDRSKLSRAMDGGIGKSTQWTNGSTGMTYMVTPTRKMTIGGNPFCRQYVISASRGGRSNQVNGTACVASDGSWHPV